MTEEKNKTGRHIALAVLDRFEGGKNEAGPILHRFLSQTTQRRLATDLVFGVIRNRDCLDMIITKVSSVPTARISKRLLNILRIGTYELVFSPDTADYAIVNEAAEQAKTLAGKKQTAFVNAVLRQIARQIENRCIAFSQADVRKTIPNSTQTGCLFKINLAADPDENPAEYFSTVFSLPLWLVSDWLTGFGREKTLAICHASNRRPSIYLRCNTLKTTLADLAESLRSQSIELEVVQAHAMLKLTTHVQITELPGFTDGLFAVQDLTASLPARLLAPQPGGRTLDLCAAPGTKTTQLAELMQNKGTVIATDIDADRLKKVSENCHRLGITMVETVEHDNFLRDKSMPASFDAVLLDVPCSNTGVLARRCEVRLRIEQKSISELAKKQANLIETAAGFLKTGGKICYSTCSIQTQENDKIVQEFLSKNSSFELLCQQLTLPSADLFDHDGGYAAILVKK